MRKKKLRVMWDYGAENPVWNRHGGIGLESLGLSTELCAALRRWSAALTEEMWEVIQTDDEELTAEARRLDDEGRRLAERVQAELGNRYAIRYVGVDD